MYDSRYLEICLEKKHEELFFTFFFKVGFTPWVIARKNRALGESVREDIREQVVDEKCSPFTIFFGGERLFFVTNHSITAPPECAWLVRRIGRFSIS